MTYTFFGSPFLFLAELFLAFHLLFRSGGVALYTATEINMNSNPGLHTVETYSHQHTKFTSNNTISYLFSFFICSCCYFHSVLLFPDQMGDHVYGPWNQHGLEPGIASHHWDRLLPTHRIHVQ